MAIVQKVLAATPNGALYWTAQPTGILRHNNSGLACGAAITAMPLVELRMLSDSPVPDGSVICRYSDNTDNAVYDVQAFSPGKALGGQEAFDSNREALTTAYPDAKSVMTFPGISDPEARGEAFVISAGGKRRLFFLCVSVVHEWVVVVRFTAAPLPPNTDEVFIKQMATWLSNFPKAVLYRGMHGVVVKQLSLPEPKDGY